MDRQEMRELARQTGRLARVAAGRLERELGDDGGDMKTAKDLSAILKDLSALALQLDAGESRDVTVRFLDGSDGAAG